ncbi:MAG: hypothetical protein J0H39_13920 [Alphaproteobacteria bacterium]|nr:hypothetical protein [Alphaproteobacteria bacterium]
MAGSKPGERRGGRKKGTPNKLTRDVKSAILAAFDKVGGEKYLAEQARKNPQAFLTLLGKVMPTQHVGDPEKPINHVVEWRVVDPARNREGL